MPQISKEALSAYFREVSDSHPMIKTVETHLPPVSVATVVNGAKERPVLVFPLEVTGGREITAVLRGPASITEIRERGLMLSVLPCRPELAISTVIPNETRPSGGLLIIDAGFTALSDYLINKAARIIEPDFARKNTPESKIADRIMKHYLVEQARYFSHPRLSRAAEQPDTDLYEQLKLPEPLVQQHLWTRGEFEKFFGDSEMPSLDSF